MRRDAGRETWHRLLEWDHSSTDAERLAASILSLEGYGGIDPSHPLGGPDEKRDLSIIREDKLWIVGVFFPRGKKRFSEVKEKFISDSKAIQIHKASGFVFVTNQEISLSERDVLLKSSLNGNCDIFHLERIAQILNQPKGYGVRLDFLGIELSKEEQIAVISYKDEIIDKLIAYITQQRNDNTKSIRKEAIEVIAKPIRDIYSYTEVNSRIHFCSHCGFGYKVSDTTLYSSVAYLGSGGLSITCPKCGNTEHYHKFY